MRALLEYKQFLNGYFSKLFFEAVVFYLVEMNRKRVVRCHRKKSYCWHVLARFGSMWLVDEEEEKKKFETEENDGKEKKKTKYRSALRALNNINDPKFHQASVV